LPSFLRLAVMPQARDQPVGYRNSDRHQDHVDLQRDRVYAPHAREPAPTSHVVNLPGLVRCALALHDQELAARLTEGIEPRTPLADHALCATRAALTEAAGDPAEAAALYAGAAERWATLGDVPERAHALLGHGRCLLADGQTDAELPLAQAHDLFASMGYNPALAETESLLARAAAPAP